MKTRALLVAVLCVGGACAVDAPDVSEQASVQESALRCGGDDDHHGKTAICHATGSATKPFVLLTVPNSALPGHRHHRHDIIPAPPQGCPGGEPPPVCTPGSTAACYDGPAGTAGVGTCAAGTQVCNAEGSGYGACTGSVGPSADVCGDGLDTDCDGAVDETCVCAPGSVASCYEGPSGTQGVGICLAGTQVCDAAGAGYGPCTGSVGPAAEECNGLDDDCDALVDEDGVCCPAGSSVCSGVCVDLQTDTQNCGACGTTCNSGDVCGAGVCRCPAVVFSEDFSGNSAGWTLGLEWQIGPAVSNPVPQGNPDPAADHTPTADNGIAGVVIGGFANPNMNHPFRYLTSPPINALGGDGGPLTFSFWRWLNSDQSPFMISNVEVFNGSVWIQVWQQPPGGPLFDNAWTLQTFDISAHRNAALRVRFGFTVMSVGVFSVSSWNVDDVTIMNGSPTCQ